MLPRDAGIAMKAGVVWYDEAVPTAAGSSPGCTPTQTVAVQLVGEIKSPNFWRRQTARRLLAEREPTGVAAPLKKVLREAPQPYAVLGAMYTLHALGQLNADDVLAVLNQKDAGVRVHGLRLSERWLRQDERLLDRLLTWDGHGKPEELLQLALSLGETGDPGTVPALATLAREHGQQPALSLF